MRYRAGCAHRAACIAVEAHAGQRDKQGRDYILHPARVAAAVHPLGEVYAAVAWLHDVVEDDRGRRYTFVGLARDTGIGEEGERALRLLTYDKVGTYVDYIERIATAEGEAGEIARAVKLADVRDNYERIPENAEGEKWERRTRKYERALERLER